MDLMLHARDLLRHNELVLQWAQKGAETSPDQDTLVPFFFNELEFSAQPRPCFGLYKGSPVKRMRAGGTWQPWGCAAGSLCELLLLGLLIIEFRWP